jgi:putative DNA primase/helicase
MRQCGVKIGRRLTDAASRVRDLISDSAISVHGLTPDAVQIALTQGIEMAERRRSLRGSAKATPVSSRQKAAADQGPAADNVLSSARASTFRLSAVQWLWPDRFALGKLGILAGLPDEGKGQIFADIAARVTRGDEWPCEEGRAPKGNVILLSAEDDASDTVVPRLMAAGADLNRIEIVSMVRAEKTDRMFSLITDLPLLRRKIKEVGDVKLLQIDPISAYLGIGKIDSFRTTDVRAVLAPLVELANELKVAIIGIMHFNKKTDVTNALLRISDSLAFGATARHVFAVCDDPENKRKLLIRGKNNLATKDLKALAYNFGVREIGEDLHTHETIRAPHILWHPRHVDVTASEAMQAGTRAPAARDDAKKFLADLLSNGPVAKSEIEDAAKGHGIAERTLFRAKAELNVTARKQHGQHGAWMWQLPERRAITGDD